MWDWGGHYCWWPAPRGAQRCWNGDPEKDHILQDRPEAAGFVGTLRGARAWGRG